MKTCILIPCYRHGKALGAVLERLKAISLPVIVIDDVITAGTAIRESDSIIKKAGGHFKGAVIALNREEKGTAELSAIDEVQNNLGIRVVSIITFSDLITYLEEDEMMKSHLKAMYAYREVYGA